MFVCLHCLKSQMSFMARACVRQTVNLSIYLSFCLSIFLSVYLRTRVASFSKKGHPADNLSREYRSSYTNPVNISCTISTDAMCIMLSRSWVEYDICVANHVYESRIIYLSDTPIYLSHTHKTYGGGSKTLLGRQQGLWRTNRGDCGGNSMPPEAGERRLADDKAQNLYSAIPGLVKRSIKVVVLFCWALGTPPCCHALCR